MVSVFHDFSFGRKAHRGLAGFRLVQVGDLNQQKGCVENSAMGCEPDHASSPRLIEFP